MLQAVASTSSIDLASRHNLVRTARECADWGLAAGDDRLGHERRKTHLESSVAQCSGQF